MRDVFLTLSPAARILVAVTILWLAGFLMSRVTKVLKLPNVTGYILAGVAIGPYALDLIPSDIVSGMEFITDIALAFIAFGVGRYLRLDRLKRNKVQRALDIAGLQLTPEVYTARAWVTAGAVGLCAIPMAFLIPLLVPILIGLAVALWFSTYYAAFDFVKKRRKLIEGEIPRFALTVGQSLENDRDVLKILTSYRRVAGKDFGAELDQTIADMKTGNYENALIRFETRIGSPMLSDVIRGLIGVLRGDDQRMYFKMITFDMRQIEQNNLKKEAAKRPKKIQRYSMMMLICIMIIYLVVLCTEVMSSLGAFFG